MAQQQDDRYTFDDLPLNPVESGTSLLVTGPGLSGAREMGLRLLCSPDTNGGTVLVATDSDATTMLKDFERHGGALDRERVRVIDCAQESGDLSEDNVSTVNTPADLTGIGIEYSGQYESTYASGYTRVRTGIITLTPLLVYSDDVRAVYRFLNTITGRIGTADGLGICVLDPNAHEEQVVESVARFFDGRVDIRADQGDLDLRVAGLQNQPTNWTPVGT
ncbi:KaiC/GvpD/RAD55 family RecA-like ATPase [Haloarcula quadrata]|jgi:hypothetical protein|uniref:KaiC-like domain-containing protein n=3 Tax=Haloarcula TaxID=2237 RepID=M0JVB9_9EURY|nr:MULTISPECIES: hypothetical protein [Haloarcula]EMA12926.1 hypothetical protein C436_14275 [Haloarcula sinaiiensis ATCC 33800]EMA17601.1 hypothetical protein C435_10614 [Haloarcula californiae ATCC 33799]NHX39315.1 hypothetical protein [Haloarcula sp. R1-2]QUJ71235.1 hypothetical protein KDQ40_10955 [Haloarcula sinaiiensis ATCC 33800]RKS84046.1 KaiC/GvpD/RAD55 family RecA-like ATPase [Haloarcula quadrata]